MVDLQLMGICFCFGECAEAVGIRIAADSERDALCQELPCLQWCQPLRFWRFPVDEIEIGVFVVRRSTFGMFVLQLAHDLRTSFLVHCQPKPLTSAIAVGKLLTRRVQMPEINKSCFHNSQSVHPKGSLQS